MSTREQHIREAIRRAGQPLLLRDVERATRSIESVTGTIDCRSHEGILIGLVDGIIAQARVVARTLRAERPSAGLREALADLAADEDVAFILAALGVPMPTERSDTEYGVQYDYPDRSFVAQGYTEPGARRQVNADRKGFAPLPARVMYRECGPWLPVDDTQEGTT